MLKITKHSKQPSLPITMPSPQWSVSWCCD
jgi:hypothetical protein